MIIFHSQVILEDDQNFKLFELAKILHINREVYQEN